MIGCGWKMVRVAGVEPTTCGFGGRHSIQLSYTRRLFTVNLSTPQNRYPIPPALATASKTRDRNRAQSLAAPERGSVSRRASEK
jgi:hypothetical protein